MGWSLLYKENAVSCDSTSRAEWRAFATRADGLVHVVWYMLS